MCTKLFSWFVPLSHIMLRQLTLAFILLLLQPCILPKPFSWCINILTLRHDCQIISNKLPMAMCFSKGSLPPLLVSKSHALHLCGIVMAARHTSSSLGTTMSHSIAPMPPHSCTRHYILICSTPHWCCNHGSSSRSA